MKKSLFILLFLLFTSLFLTPVTQAKSLWESQEGLEKIGSQAYGIDDPENDDRQIQIVIARVIKATLGLLGTVFLVLLVWAGYKYMTSQGSEDKITESIGQIRTAIIGIVIILMSWSIVSYITDCLLDITQGGMIWMCS
jgi:hypothetical protein